ncbi:MAG: zeta toxin family protein [Alphaproteobacteria bacterium]|nr:zeta toxin family protein [Alphaproteobacteria bacterium]
MQENPLFFSGYQYYLSHNDEEAPSLDEIIQEMDGFVSINGVKYSAEDIRKQISEVEKAVRNIEMTIDKYRLSGEKRTAIYTEERKKLHTQIMNEFVIQKATPQVISEDPRVLIMLGGRPESGKSSCFRGVVYDDSFIVLDPDEIKSRLPEYKGWNAEEVHEESGDILEKCIQIAKKLRLNIVIETTMGTTGSALRRIKEFKQSGYKVEAHYMFLPMHQACKRAMERFLNGTPTGRYIPIEILHQMKNTEENFDIIKSFVDGWSFYSNENSDKTGKPECIAEYGDIYLKRKQQKERAAMMEHFQDMAQAVRKTRRPYVKPEAKEITSCRAEEILSLLQGNEQ